MRNSSPIEPFPKLGLYLQRGFVTPLVPLRLKAGEPVIWCKLEFLNPSGSSKDRIARNMLEKAWRRGELRPGGWVVEASSGSTGIALALVCAQLGLRFLAVIPEGVSGERLLAIRAYGGEVLTVPREIGMAGAIECAEREALARGGFATRQFENPDNVEAHRQGTALEILAEIPGGRVDAVVSGVGTGGTLMGLLQGFRSGGCLTRPVLARPTCRTVLSDLECCSFSSRIPGVLDGFSKLCPSAELQGLKVLEIEEEEALTTARKLIRLGFPVGPSSGLNVAAAVRVAREMEPDSYVVTVLPDRMERYFSTDLFASLCSLT